MAEKKGTQRSAASTRGKSAARRVAAKTPGTTPTTQEALAALAGQPVLTEEQKKVSSATKATSKIEAGGTEKVDEGKIRMESEGVLTPIKSDFDNPESPVVGDPAGALVGPKEPGKVKIGPGETAAQHEAHSLMSHPARIAERIKLESGPDGLPTDVIARRQQEEIAKTEFQRVQGPNPGDPDTVQPGLNDDSKKASTPPR